MPQPVRRLTVRLLKKAGLTTASRLKEVSDSLVRAEDQIKRLRQSLESSQKESAALKAKMRQREEKARQREERDQAQAGAAEERRAERQQQFERKTAAEVQRVREEDASRTRKLDEVRRQVDANEKLNYLGREHLMALEVKLDIVEGAIKVLDQRTRAALAAGRGQAPS